MDTGLVDPAANQPGWCHIKVVFFRSEPQPVSRDNITDMCDKVISTAAKLPLVLFTSFITHDACEIFARYW